MVRRLSAACLDDVAQELVEKAKLGIGEAQNRINKAKSGADTGVGKAKHVVGDAKSDRNIRNVMTQDVGVGLHPGEIGADVGRK
jgi:hypothetical protein